MRRRLFPLLLLLLPTAAEAHAVRHEITRTEALELRLTYANGSSFADASVEIARVGSGEVVWEGQTDEEGRVVFVPEEEGPWRCRAFSDNGHGTQFTFEAPEQGGMIDLSTRPPAGRWREIGVGLGVIALLFAGLTCWSTRRSRVVARDGTGG